MLSAALVAGFPLSPTALGQTEGAAARPSFESWMDDLRAEALEQGFAPTLVEDALGSVSRIERAVTRDRNQPEFKQTYDTYLKQRVSPWRIEKGRAMLAEHGPTFRAVEDHFGIQPRFVAAIWGIETNYGTIELTYPALDVLATLAHEGRREKFFKKEIFSALTILQEEFATLDLMKSSWAGAMGQPQFMPSMYLEYAQDFDGDGRRNIWTSTPDVLASVARHLQAVVWLDDETWGRPVVVPEGGIALSGSVGLDSGSGCRRFRKSLGTWRALADWQDMGLRRLNGDDLPSRNIPAAFIPPQDGGNKGYIVYRNFCTIMWYNPSFKYAIAVGLLADEIGRSQ